MYTYLVSGIDSNNQASQQSFIHYFLC